MSSGEFYGTTARGVRIGPFDSQEELEQDLFELNCEENGEDYREFPVRLTKSARAAEGRFQRAVRRDEGRTAVFSIRISPENRAEIARLAAEANMSQADFVIEKALGRSRSVLERRIGRLELRCRRLEAKSFGVALSDSEFDDLGGAGL